MFYQVTWLCYYDVCVIVTPLAKSKEENKENKL